MPKIKSPGEEKEGLKAEVAQPLAAPPGWRVCSQTQQCLFCQQGEKGRAGDPGLPGLPGTKVCIFSDYLF